MVLSSINTWVIFHLIAFAVLLWAVFLTVEGQMLWVSLTLVIVVVGISFSVIFSEVKKQLDRKTLQEKLITNLEKKE